MPTGSSWKGLPIQLDRFEAGHRCERLPTENPAQSWAGAGAVTRLAIHWQKERWSSGFLFPLPSIYLDLTIHHQRDQPSARKYILYPTLELGLLAFRAGPTGASPAAHPSKHATASKFRFQLIVLPSGLELLWHNCPRWPSWISSSGFKLCSCSETLAMS